MNMFLKLKIYLVSIGFYAVVNAQTNSNNVAEYHVNADNSNYIFYPNDSYFFAGTHRNKIKITQKGVAKKIEVSVNNGKITKLSDSVFVVSALKPGTAMLSIYELTKDNKKKIVKNKEYSVFDYPNMSINGVKCDSFISKILLAGGIIKAFAEIENKKTYLKVLGFKMEIYNAAKGFSLDSSITDKLTSTMRKYVSSINDGGIFYIREIKYSFPDGTTGVIPMYRVFLVKDDRRPFEFGM